MNKTFDTTAFTVPARHNPRLQLLVDRLGADAELRQLWGCANVNAVERLEMSDHGEVHLRIVANAALRLLRLLREAGHPASLVTHYRFAPEEAEVVVVLAAALHDLGISIHYDNHADYSLLLARLKAKEVLADLYPVREQTILISEILHAIAAHHGQLRCLTLEAGILKLADALDMTAGRARPLGALNGKATLVGGLALKARHADARGREHALGDFGVDQVLIKRGDSKPVRLEVHLNRATGLQRIEDMLYQKLQHSPLFGLVEVIARTEWEALPLREMA